MTLASLTLEKQCVCTECYACISYVDSDVVIVRVTVLDH